MRRALAVAALLLVPALGVAHSQGYAASRDRPADLDLAPDHRHARAEGGRSSSWTTRWRTPAGSPSASTSPPGGTPPAGGPTSSRPTSGWTLARPPT